MSDTAVPPAIALHNLTVSYRQHPALHHMNGAFAQGSLTAVMGPMALARAPCSKASSGCSQ